MQSCSFLLMDWSQLREKALVFTRKQVAQSVGDDNLISQSISAIEDVDKAANLLVRRLREWYELYSPEFSRKVSDNESFVRLILEKDKSSQLSELGLEVSMGADLPQHDVDQMLSLAASIQSLYAQRESLESYVESIMRVYCPNLCVLAGATIGARLLREAGSLRRLAMEKASTIQLFGAEKALFRHIKSGARPPKHGYIVNHPLVAKASSKDKGKVARALADKLAIACRVDYFKGEPVGESLRLGLQKRFGGESL